MSPSPPVRDPKGRRVSVKVSSDGFKDIYKDLIGKDPTRCGKDASGRTVKPDSSTFLHRFSKGKRFRYFRKVRASSCLFISSKRDFYRCHFPTVYVSNRFKFFRCFNFKFMFLTLILCILFSQFFFQQIFFY